MKIPFSRVDCRGNELKYVEEVLASGWLTTASRVAAFEEKFREFIGCKHALAVNSCTSALHLALEAVGVKEGDRVLVPTLTFTATAEVIRYLGAEPVFVDIDYETGMICLKSVERAIKADEAIKACMVVHFGGQAAQLGGDEGLLGLCARYGVEVVQDAAHAFPSLDDYGFVGSLGKATCFSFYANKTMTTGEGGMVVTNDDEFASRIRLMRLHGIDRDVWGRFTEKASSWEYDVMDAGFKYNMPDLNAAVGLAQLERASEFRESRQRIAEKYFDWVGNEKRLVAMSQRVPSAWHSWHLFPVLLRSPNVQIRNRLIDDLSLDGIGVSVHYKPLHRMTYYKHTFNLKEESFPGAERYWQSCISLPIYPQLTDDEVNYVTERISYHLNNLL